MLRTKHELKCCKWLKLCHFTKTCSSVNESKEEVMHWQNRPSSQRKVGPILTSSCDTSENFYDFVWRERRRSTRDAENCEENKDFKTSSLRFLPFTQNYHTLTSSDYSMLWHVCIFLVLQKQIKEIFMKLSNNLLSCSCIIHMWAE